MKALVMSDPLHLGIQHVEEPLAGPEDVVIRVRATGICAGDQHLYAGRNPYASYPVIGGHEICGVVEQIGTGVRNVALGQLVVIEPVVGCGRCRPCRRGKHNCCVNFCLIGVHRPGGFAERVLAPSKQVHPVPDGVDPITASFAEPLTIGLHACHRGEVSASDLVLVLGAGPIGLAIIETARLRGAKVFASDPNETRLRQAVEFGAESLPSGNQLLPTLLERTEGAGADVVLEATGVPRAIEAAVDLVAHGGRIVVVGLVPRGIPVSLPGLDLTRKEVNILGSRNSTNCFPEALALLASGAIRYPRVATPIPMWEGPGVFAQLHAEPAAIHKGVLVLDQTA